MTTRTAGRTARVSTISVSRAPMSVVIALSACGRFRVTSATRSSERYSRRTGESGSAVSDCGGAKSSDFQRSVVVEVVATSSCPSGSRESHVSCLEFRQPAHCSEAGGEAVLAAAGDDEGRHLLQPPPDRLGGNGETAGAVIRPDERVHLGRGADEDAVVQPLGLDELELPLEVRSGEDENDAPVGAVVFENSLGQRWAVARPAPDHPVQADVDTTLCVKGVPRVGASGMRTGRTLQAAEIVGIEEVVVPAPVCPELGIVLLRGEHERSAALPAADHLGAKQGLLLPAGGLGTEILPIGSHLRMQLPEHDVGAVSTENLRGWHRRRLTRLVRVAEDDLTGLERLLLRVRGGHVASFDGRLADPVLEAEGGAPGGELVAILIPDDLHALKLLVGATYLLDGGLEPRGIGRERGQRDVHVGSTEWLLPIVGAARPHVAQLDSARRHPLLELRREAVKRVLRYAKRLQALIRESNGDPGVVLGIG